MSVTYSIGIDLGTSRSSIATSTGVRLTTRSVVGYPKDLISQKRFKKPFLFGEEAMDNRLSLDMVWPLAEGNIVAGDKKAIEATSLILKHVIAEAIPDKQPRDKIYAAVGVPAQASINNKKLILEATKDFIDKILIVSEPFAVAYSEDMFEEALIVDIGAGTTDLCFCRGTFPTEDDQVTVDKGGNFLDNVILKGINEKYPQAQVTSNMVRNLKEKYASLYSKTDPIVAIFPVKGIQTEFDLTDIFHQACSSLVDPVCEAIQDLIGSIDPEFQAKVRSNIMVAGGGSRLKGIDQFIEKRLVKYGGGNVKTAQDAEFCGCVGCLKMCLEIPENLWEQI